jgi:hypothetical protein
MPAPTLKFKRGLLSNLPVLNSGEPGFTTDFHDFYVGSAQGNKLIGSGRFWTTETAATGGAVKVYEATANGTNSVSFAAPANLASDITYTFPASPTNNFFLKTNGSGDLSWAAVVSSFSISADSGSNDTVNTGETLNFAGTSNEIETSVSDNQVQIGLPDNVTISGNLTINGDFLVEGSETIINTQRLDVEDKKIGIGSTSSPSDSTADGAGIEVYGANNYNILWQNDTDSWEVNQNFSPSVDDTYDLGRSDQQWRNLYVDGLAELDAVNVSVAATIASLSLVDGVAVATILDEDNLNSDRDDALATQQSIKAYVDTQISAQDLDVAGDSGTGAVDLDSQSLTIAGTANEIVTLASGQTVTVGLPDDVTVGAALTVAGALDINGGADISGGETTISSATISDLTSGRVVLAGASGALDDSTNLTYGGGGLIIGAGGLNVTGVSTFSSTVDVNGLLDAIDVNVSGAATVSGNMKIGSLNVNDDAGDSLVITYSGGERILQNITVDAGSF